MTHFKSITLSLALLGCGTLALPMSASANTILDGYRAQARLENAAFKDFSVVAGQTLYRTVGPNQLACASCRNYRIQRLLERLVIRLQLSRMGRRRRQGNVGS